jgi:hypothetical protein
MTVSVNNLVGFSLLARCGSCSRLSLLSLSLAFLVAAIWVRDPRLMLHSDPEDVRAAVALKASAEMPETTVRSATLLVLILAATRSRVDATGASSGF